MKMILSSKNGSYLELTSNYVKFEDDKSRPAEKFVARICPNDHNFLDGYTGWITQQFDDRRRAIIFFHEMIGTNNNDN